MLHGCGTHTCVRHTYMSRVYKALTCVWHKHRIRSCMSHTCVWHNCAVHAHYMACKHDKLRRPPGTTSATTPQFNDIYSEKTIMAQQLHIGTFSKPTNHQRRYNGEQSPAVSVSTPTQHISFEPMLNQQATVRSNDELTLTSNKQYRYIYVTAAGAATSQ